MKAHSARATCTRIVDSDTMEYTTKRGFLWQNVTDMEACNPDRFPFKIGGPKTLIYFTDDTVITVLGKVDKWLNRWDGWLEAQQRERLVFPHN